MSEGQKMMAQVAKESISLLNVLRLKLERTKYKWINEWVTLIKKGAGYC